MGFTTFLLSVGNGDEYVIIDDMIRLPPHMVISADDDNSINNLIDHIFPNISHHNNDERYMVERAIITPLNEDTNKINEKVLERFPGDTKVYYSFDSVPDDTRNLYQQELLNSTVTSELPPHVLK